MTTPSSAERPVLDIEQFISGPPDAVFEAWLDPEQLKLWFCGGSTTVSQVEIDARVGGAYRIVMSDGDRDWPHTGIYQEIDPPRRLVFTWRTPSTNEQETLVTVTLKAEAGARAAAGGHLGSSSRRLDRADRETEPPPGVVPDGRRRHPKRHLTARGLAAL